jgi:acetyl esterase/lipase
MSEATRTRDRPSGGLLHALFTLAKPAAFTAREPSEAGVRYAERVGRGIPPLCDVYVPESGTLHPSVVVVHGGGFVIGSRHMKPVRLVATRLVDAGFAVCAIDYRLLLRGGGLHEQLADVTDAAAFWRARAERFGCDPARISMLGFSAGATLVMLHAGKSDARYHKLVSIYGATDFERVSGARAELLLAWVLGTRDRRAWRELSPVAHASMPTPTLIIHGTHDELVPVTHAELLHETRLARGLPSELELVPGMPHGWFNDATHPETERGLGRVIAFLRD